jgi:gamma-glutamyltranspeptidase
MVLFTPALLLQALQWLSRPAPAAEPPLTGATACEVQQCADIGTSLLARGGSAADALVGMAACVGTIASYHSGFGAWASVTSDGEAALDLGRESAGAGRRADCTPPD